LGGLRPLAGSRPTGVRSASSRCNCRSHKPRHRANRLSRTANRRTDRRPDAEHSDHGSKPRDSSTRDNRRSIAERADRTGSTMCWSPRPLVRHSSPTSTLSSNTAKRKQHARLAASWQHPRIGFLVLNRKQSRNTARFSLLCCIHLRNPLSMIVSAKTRSL